MVNQRHIDPDIDLLLRWRAGDSHAGSMLYRRYVDLVDRVLARKWRDELYQEHRQEAFLIAWKDRKPYRGGPVRAYLLGIAYNLFRSDLRKAKRREQLRRHWLRESR